MVIVGPPRVRFFVLNRFAPAGASILDTDGQSQGSQARECDSDQRGNAVEAGVPSVS